MASATYLQSLDATYEDGTSRGATPPDRDWETSHNVR